MKDADSNTVERSLRTHTWSGFAIAAVLAGGIGTWAATTEISGAIVASGLLVVESSVKKIQHPSGGVVGELLVQEGDHVEKGEVLVRLDATQTRANLSIVERSIDELTAREARLDAERVGASKLELPALLTMRTSDQVVAKLLAGEAKLFELRQRARAGQKAQLRERIQQLEKEIYGLNEQAVAKEAEINLLDKELAGVRVLWKKKLIQITRLTALERDAARLVGERGRLMASIAQANGKIAEVKLQIIQIDEETRSDAAEELSQVRAKLSELSERRVAAEDELKRIDIRSPQAGTVHELQAHTVGGVVAAGEPIMLIVPDADHLTVEARVSPSDIDQLKSRQPAMLHFSAFSLGTTPDIPGHVTRIGADLSEDKSTGEKYYVVRVAFAQEDLAVGRELELVPGMPVEVFMETNPRTVLSFLVKPLRDQLARTWREV